MQTVRGLSRLGTRFGSRIGSRFGRRSAMVSRMKSPEEIKKEADTDGYYSDFSKNGMSFQELNEEFALSATAHGFSRIAMAKKHRCRQVVWILLVSTAMGGFLYHVSFLLSNYFSYPVTTSTEEIHAHELEFPQITVCNLNIMKKSKFEEYLKQMVKLQESQALSTTEFPDFLATTSATGGRPTEEMQCFKSSAEIVNRSRTMDLSDMWVNLVATKKQLRDYGHQAHDMIVQCSFSSKDCFNLTSNIVSNDPYPSPRYGLCHTLTMNREERVIVKSGAGMGLQMTLNIERSEYMDIVSGEYGARVVVHPMGTRPSLDSGGVILLPGSKTYISAKMRNIKRLPEPYRGCTSDFSESPLTEYLKERGLATLIDEGIVYTYEYCQTLCTESFLFQTCNCLDELAVDKGRNAKIYTSCDACNAVQSRCRRTFYRTFITSLQGKKCRVLCKPECNEVRYDITTSLSEWPNFRNTYQAIQKFSNLNKRLEASGVNWSVVAKSTDDLDFIEEADEFRRNFLRVHVYISEMNFMLVMDQESYAMPQLIADLGGCLGLYIGVSVLSLMEFSEHAMRCFQFGCVRYVIPTVKLHKHKFIPKALRRKTTRRLIPMTSKPQSRVPSVRALRNPNPPPAMDEGLLSRLGRRRSLFRGNQSSQNPKTGGYVPNESPRSVADLKHWAGQDQFQGYLSTRQRLEGLTRTSQIGRREPLRSIVVNRIPDAHPEESTPDEGQPAVQ